VLYNGYLELTRATGPGMYFSFPELRAPTDLAATNADVTKLLDTAQADFATGATDLSSGDYTDGAMNISYTLGTLIEVPEVEFIGLTDTLLSSL
jgi:hypothetical protein